MAKDSNRATPLEIEQFKHISNAARARAMYAYLTQRGVDQATAGREFTSDSVQAAWLMSTVMRAYGFYNQEGGRNGGRYPGDPPELIQDFVKEYCPERKGAAPEGAYNTYRQKWYEKQNSKKQPKRTVQKSAPARKTQATRPAAGVQAATARQVSSFQPGSETFAPVSAPVSAPLTGLKKFLVEILDLFMLLWSGLLLWMHLDVLHGFSKIIFMLVMGITTFVSAQYAVRGFSQRKPFLLIIFGILLRFTVILTLYFVMLVKLGF